MTSSQPERADPSDAALVEAGQSHRADDLALAERVDVERAVMPWSSWLSATRGATIELTTVDGSRHRGQVDSVGERWVLLAAEHGDRLVFLDRVVLAEGIGPGGVAPGLTRGPGSVLRRWAETRARVVVRTVDGAQVGGRIASVLADAVELTLDDVRDRADSGRRVLVPIAGVVWVGAEGGLAQP